MPSPCSKVCDGDHAIPLRESRGLSCEIVRTCARIRSLTTGTFNLIVKDRIAFRLSGAPSVQPETHKCESDRPRNLTNILCRENHCQPIRPTGFPDDFHIGNRPRPVTGDPENRDVIPNRASGPASNLFCDSGDASLPHAQQYGLPLWFQSLARAPENGARQGGRLKIEKRSFWRSLL